MKNLITWIQAQPMWAQYVIVFFLMGAVDTCWALYNRRSAHGRAVWAGLFSAGIVATSTMSTILVVNNHEMLPVIILAAFIFTALAVRLDHGKG